VKLEDRVRQSLTSGLSSIRPTEDAWNAIERGIARRVGRRMAVTIVAAAAASLVAVAALWAVWLALRPTAGRNDPPGQVGSKPVVTPTISATIDVAVGGQPASLVSSHDSLWVAADVGDLGDTTLSVFRVDTATNEIATELLIDAYPDWEEGGDGMAVDDDAVWVTGVGADGARLVRIDPATNTVAATITLDGQAGGDVDVGEAAVWVSVASSPTRVARIDPTTNQVVATVVLEVDWVREVIAMGDVVLVRGLSQDQALGALDADTQILTVIDPATNEVLVSNEVDAYGPFVAGAGVIWTMAPDGLLRIDPRTAQPVGAPIPVGARTSRVLLAAGEEGLWFFGRDPAEPSASPTVDLIDPATGVVVASVELPSFPLAMVSGPGSLWVLHPEGTVTRIDV
jgi:DNA-binding beta-propeller fold protein YncE